MTLRLPAVLGLAVLAASASAVAQPAHPPSPPQLSLQTLRDVDRTLASDEFEGRAPTTHGEELSIAYIAQRFRQAGLQPGNHGSWFQDVPMAEIRGHPSALTISGGAVPLTFQPTTDMVAVTYRLQPHVDLTNSPMVFVGYGIHAPERGWDDYAGVDVHGKTVVILVNDPDWQSPDLNGPFNGRAMTYYGRWTYKFEEAARQGAAAAIIIHQTEPAAYGWNVIQSSWTNAQYELDDPANHMDQSEVIGWVTHDAAERLFASAGQNLEQLTRAAGQRGFHAVPLSTRASITLDNTIRRSMSHNVIGILPGRSAPQDTVLFTAHWDHLGRCTPVNGDNICNGAIDNGSGIAGLVALAEANVHAGPARRSIIFMAVTAEELGLLGSRYYAEHPIYPLGHTVGGVNMDVLNMYGVTRDLAVTGPGKSELDAYLQRAADERHLVVRPEPNPEQGHYYRSDHFSFARVGVPMLDASSGEDMVNGGVTAGHAAVEDYRLHHYHQPSDEYNPNWDWSGAIRDLGIYYEIGRELADSDAWPNWTPGDEFRAIRDRSRAGQ